MTQTRFEEVFLGYAANTISQPRVIARELYSAMKDIGAPEWTKEEFKVCRGNAVQFRTGNHKAGWLSQLEEIWCKTRPDQNLWTLSYHIAIWIVVGSGLH